jgi:phage terminase small subunit
MIRVTPNLSEQQVCFCDEYLVSFNAYRSAISAGYSENTARKGELLHYPKIQEYLRMKMQQRSEWMEITHDMILREYAKIAFSSMANYYDQRGDLKPACELTETEMAAISFLQTTNIAEPDGYIVGAVTKIKLHNKMAALDKIAKHLGFFEKIQESRGKNQDEEQEVENQALESRAKNQDKELEALAVDVDGGLEIIEGNGIEKDEKNLTLSPLVGEMENGDLVLSNCATGGTLAGVVSDQDTLKQESPARWQAIKY